MPESRSRREILRGLGKWAMAIALLPFWPKGWAGAGNPGRPARKEGPMKLPGPVFDGEVPLERAIKTRRTIRSFAPEPVSLPHLSQLLWAAQGITEEGGFKRAAPSGGALYPVDVYAVVGDGGVEGSRAGIYHYEPRGHLLSLLTEGDLRDAVARAALGQMWMARAPVTMVITADYGRICVKYGERGVRYAMIEAGHVGQNIFLQAEALGLGAGIVGAFHDREVTRVMNTPKTHEPLLIMPVGYKR
jgi:SagB-type dehydrogenase family enzyme